MTRRLPINAGHHAGPGGASTCFFEVGKRNESHGFCLLSNAAIGAARALARGKGVERVAIVDFDVHHGNGTEECVRNLSPHRVSDACWCAWLHKHPLSISTRPRALWRGVQVTCGQEPIVIHYVVRHFYTPGCVAGVDDAADAAGRSNLHKLELQALEG